MTIRDLDKYVARLWNWAFLDNCFGATRIRVTDLDGLVEHHDCFLFIEAKGIGAQVPRGQQRLFNALKRRGDAVLILWGDPGEPRLMSWWPKPSRPCTTEEVQAEVSRWFAWSERKVGQ